MEEERWRLGVNSACLQVEHNVVQVGVLGILAWLAVLLLVLIASRPPVVPVVNFPSSPRLENLILLILQPVNCAPANQILTQPSAATIA